MTCWPVRSAVVDHDKLFRWVCGFIAQWISCSFISRWGNCCYDLGQNICRLFNFLAQFVFTTSETGLDYYDHKVNVMVASQVA